MRHQARLAHLIVGTLLCVSCKEPTALKTPAKLIVVAGDGQSVTNAPAALAQPLVVKVLDAKDRPVSNVSVSWSASDGGSTSPATSTTGSDGTAQTTWSLGSPSGRQTLRAVAGAISGGEAAAFVATNNVLSISGAVAVSQNPAVAFTFEPSSGSKMSRSETWTYDPALVAQAIAMAPIRSRRFIVNFGSAGASAMPPRGASAQRVASAMLAALSPLVMNSIIVKAEPSPAIVATRVTLSDSVPLASALQALRNTPGISSIETDDIHPMLERYEAGALEGPAKATSGSRSPTVTNIVGTLPNDPILWPTMWHYNMVDAPRVWTTQTGSSTVLVAVVDNGIRFGHPALATCSAYNACSAGNLTTDGYNFVTGGDRLASAQSVCQGGTTTITEAGYGPDPTQPDDLAFTGWCWSRSTLGDHGLHVAGTIGARGNDGVGTAGLNWNVKIRPVRVLDITGSGSYFDVAQGVLYAAGLPASDGNGGTVTAPSRAAIINMSLGGSGTSTVLSNAVAAASNAGSLIVASAGNSSSNGPFIPAAYPQVLAVSAVGPDFQLASYTNIGSNVSLSAPGGNFRSSGTAGVASTTWDFVNGAPSYAYYQGTSMASPHVAGIAALVLAASPGLSSAALRARLQNTAVHMGSPGRDDRWGYGVVDAYNAVNNVSGPVHTTYVHVVSTTTGDTVKRVAVGSDGAFNILRIPPGSYWVVGGQDDTNDGKIGRPGRRYGWFGGPGAPTVVNVSASQSGSASVLVGTPVELKPNSTVATANRLVLDGWVMGQLNATYTSSYFVIQVPRNAVYTFAADAVVGACGYGIELDPVLSLYASDGTLLDYNDDVDLTGGNYCSRVSRTLTAGTYYVVVTSSDGGPGQFALHVHEGQ